jgi:hypothetical protein
MLALVAAEREVDTSRQDGGLSQAVAFDAARRRAAPAFTSARGAFVGISVSDIEASVRWYTEKLGLAVVMRPATTRELPAVVRGGRHPSETHGLSRRSRSATPTQTRTARAP